MENFFSRYKNPLVLMAVLFIQVIALATQVKRPDSAKAAGSGGTRLIRVWTVTAITPFERAFVATGHFFRNTWHNYVDLHDVRQQNHELQKEVDRLRLEQVRLKASADESQRLRALLEFKENYVGKTVAAQIIGSGGSEPSRTVYIDRSSGIQRNMAVITPDGIVGKVKEVYPFSSQVLLISDREGGAGVILQNSRLRGILHGTPSGELQISEVMADEKVDIGELVVTSGGDGVFPKGFPVGTVTKVGSDSEGGPFLGITVKPSANLNRLEEVLVVTKIAEQGAAASEDASPHRAADILSQRLPSVSKPADNPAKPVGTAPRGTDANPPSGPADATQKATRPNKKVRKSDALTPDAGPTAPPAGTNRPQTSGTPEKPPR